MTKKKKQSTGLIIAVVMLGILDMAALAVLLAGVLISPAKGETVKAELYIESSDGQFVKAG